MTIFTAISFAAEVAIFFALFNDLGERIKEGYIEFKEEQLSESLI